MAQKTDLNVSPYYDDFDEADNFHRTLFRPGFAIQARELTQLQSTLQNQIEKYGNHIFREGAMVVPGQLSFNNKYFTLKLATTFSSETVDPSQYYNATTPVTITGATTGVTAQVIGFTAATSTDQPLLHIDYINTGTDNETIVFADGENISANAGITHTSSYSSGVASATTFTSTYKATVEGQNATDTVANLSSASGPASRVGSAVKIESGVYYIRGHFVTCSEEILVLDPYSNNPSYRVGFTVTETLVTPESDTTLLDNATGSSNFAAKGAHRLKFSLALAKLARTSTSDSNFIQLMDVLDGTVQSLVRNTEYSILEETLARRTADESGDYTVQPFQAEVRECVDNDSIDATGIYQTRSLTSGSKTEDNNTPSSDLLCLRITPGKAFIKGYEVEKLAHTIKDVKKARDFATVNAGVTSFDVGNFSFITNVYGSPDVTPITGETTAFKKLELYDDKITTRGTANGNLIGVAKTRSIEYHSGTAGSTSATFKLFLFDLQPFTKLTLSGIPSPTLLATHTNGGVQLKGATSGATGFVFASGTSNEFVNLTNVVGTFSAGEKLIASDSALTGGLIEVAGGDGSTDITVSEISIKTFADARSVFMEDADSGQDFTADFVLDAAVGEGGSLLLEPGTGEPTGSQIQLETGTNEGTDVIALESREVARLKDTEKNISLFKLPKKVIKTLLTTSNSGASDTQYTIRRQFVGTTNASGVVTFTSGSNETFLAFSEKDYTVSILTAGDGTGAQGDIVSVDGKLSGTGSGSLTITDALILGDSAKVKVTATLLKTSVIQKNKTVNLMKQLKVATGTTDAFGTRPTDITISLGRADVFNLVAVFDSESTSADATAPSLTLTNISGTFTRGEKITGSVSGTKARIIDTSSPMSFVSASGKKFTTADTITGSSSGATATVSAVTDGSIAITRRYTLDTGMRDNFYDIARIVRKTSSPAPTGRLLIVYDYMEHGSGDLMSVDSYTDVALQMRYDDIPQYAATKVDPDAQKPTGLFPLQDTYDFRPRVADIAGTSSTLSTVDEITGNSFNFNSRVFSGTGSSTVDFPKPSSLVQSDFEHYLPKMVSVHLGEYGKFSVFEGNSAENPTLPTVPEIGLKLFEVFLPAYTPDPKKVVVVRKRHQRFTMKDIGKLESRIDHVEYYTALNMLEREAESFEVTDANGLNRFKAGFVVDNFDGHRIGDTVHKDYKNSIDIENNELLPKHHMNAIRLNENNTSDAERTLDGYQKTGSLITLPYTEETIVEQPYATRVERVAAFHTFSWIGEVFLSPDGDEWFETAVAPELVVNVDGNYDAVISAVKNQTGTIWNMWESQWAGVTETDGDFVKDQDGEIVRAIETFSTDTGTTAISSAVLAQIDRESQGSKVISRAMIPFCREKKILFTAHGLKPNTKIYVFLAGFNASSFVTPANSSFSNVASPIKGSQLITSGAGAVQGHLEIPNPKIFGNLQFPTGNLQFRITSSSTNRLNRDPITAAQTIYHANGILETSQETIIATKNAIIVAEDIVETTYRGGNWGHQGGGTQNYDQNDGDGLQAFFDCNGNFVTTYSDTTTVNGCVAGSQTNSTSSSTNASGNSNSDEADDGHGSSAGADDGPGEGAAGLCWIAGTKVLMADRTRKNIEDLVVGDKVLTFAEDDRRWNTPLEAKKITEFTVGLEDIWYLNDTGTSKEEWIIRANGEAARVRWLKVGDEIMSSSGKPITVNRVEAKGTVEPVFNFMTEDNYSYTADDIRTVRGMAVRGQNMLPATGGKSAREAYEITFGRKFDQAVA